jgi:hypothetical protein
MKSRRMRRAGHTGFWRGKPEGNRALGRLKHKWEDNIKTGAWSGLIWYRMGTGGGLM